MKSHVQAETSRYLEKGWLTGALKESGMIDKQTEVTGIDASPISGGMMSNAFLVNLTYSSGESGGPKSLVAKVPSDNADSRKAGKEMQAYEREVNFYKHLSPKLKMRVPTCYYADYDAETADFVLLIEDLNPAQTCLPKNCTYEMAELSIRELARLHADSWGDENLEAFDWLQTQWNADAFYKRNEWVKNGWEVLKKAADGRVPDYFEELGDEYIRKMNNTLPDMDRYKCLIHCDYRMGNIMYRGLEESIAFDWQTVHLGRPGFDTFFFIANTFSPEKRKEYETGLLNAYYNELLENGVSGFSWEECQEDYRFGSLYSIRMLMITAHGIGATNLPESYRKQLFYIIPRFWDFLKEHNILGDF